MRRIGRTIRATTRAKDERGKYEGWEANHADTLDDLASSRKAIPASAVVGMSTLHRIIYGVIVCIARGEIQRATTNKARTWLASKA